MRLPVTRTQVLGYRRTVSALDGRLAPGPSSVRRAAAAGLKDSVPRAAVLSLHARLDGVGPRAWAEPPLVQVWGPGYAVHAVARDDVAVFTLGRLPRDATGLERAVDMADRLVDALGEDELDYADAARPLGVHPNALRYAAPTGRILLRWDGAHRPTVRAAPAPDVDPADARRELLRRYLHVLGPGTAEGYASWAGVRPSEARATFGELAEELVAVGTPAGDAWALASDEDALRAGAASPQGPGARLLPSGDTYTLLQGADRELLVPDADRRALLWTPRVWPGAVLLGGEVVGTWRRAEHRVVVEAWSPLDGDARDAVEREAAALPLDLGRPTTVTWAGPSA
ncbi:DNA glycosylase AlkZ-like family protein [Luteimicrobium sp. NPDC057192]|uniref:DNA glycosylase AlkZ-like family protein n=1 Tax=Luteimicrobium sp. NPDC057192 TaxID=3346042 RepID=UPI00363094F5